MLRSNILKSSKRLLATTAEQSTVNSNTEKTWSSGSKSDSFKAGKNYREALLNGVPKNGPPSLRSRKYKLRYTSPVGINEAFDEAYEFLKTKSQNKYELLSKETDSDKQHQLKIEAEINNPEVKFNFEFNEKLENDQRYIDYTQPVYRELKKKHWENYGQMLLMQRLESLAVIPDTLATLEPKAEVSLKFSNHTGVNRWIEPGMLLSSNSTTYSPTIKIQEFDNVDISNELYTVLIVNPDVPDIEKNSYKTQLQWGLSNVKLDFNDNVISPKKLLEDKSINEIIDYSPPVPEKNLPNQRFVTWVFRQNNVQLNEKISTRDFDIREFVEQKKLLPIGAHVWRSSWDLNVANVRDLYGLPNGTVFQKVRGKHPLN
ncbi:hypothetical protein WICMUC_004305 [Wickerhamomyces mucosus]|uniref:Large ribosomal subunit protein mL38 n=1 Tax=Wickerhamomyces mucosus TaxID=1378264 RepID=A0A9P8TB59_9ASCO|nr:hypothetical protein WICMUC_004305 [Wickerhamomyces mucosus]